MEHNPFSLKGKTIFITGASSGIGRATALECSRMGAALIINGRNEERLRATFDSLEGNGHRMLPGDLSVPECMSAVSDSLPELDGVVYCAGITGHNLLPFIKEKDVKRMFDINYYAPLWLSRSITKKKKIKKGGSIVFISSTSGIISSYAGGSIYASTKGAVNGLVKSMAIELAPRLIRVNSAMPSMVETSLAEGMNLDEEQFEEDKRRYPLKRYGKPEEVAYAVVFLLSDASKWITGTNLLIDGGRSAAY
jgi:NAD(P)-dependent dehydrogenase (short-subunit alcohol dehydrogenase family)